MEVDGPFSPRGEGGPSDFQTNMARVGLPVVTVKATGLERLSGAQDATLLQEVRTL